MPAAAQHAVQVKTVHVEWALTDCIYTPPVWLAVKPHHAMPAAATPSTAAPWHAHSWLRPAQQHVCMPSAAHASSCCHCVPRASCWVRLGRRLAYAALLMAPERTRLASSFLLSFRSVPSCIAHMHTWPPPNQNSVRQRLRDTDVTPLARRGMRRSQQAAQLNYACRVCEGNAQMPSTSTGIAAAEAIAMHWVSWPWCC